MTSGEAAFLSRYVYALEGDMTPGFSDAHRLYAWLLEQFPESLAGWLHEEGNQFIAQHIRTDPDSKKTVWSMSILSQEANEMISPLLKAKLEIGLHPETLRATLLRKDSFTTPLEFIRFAREHTVGRVAELDLLSPLAFRQDGRYVVYPQERLILQSLVNKWNISFPEYPLEDEDALSAMEKGILIRDYRLHTVRFALKGNKIPGCLGRLYLQARMAEPLFEIWNLLLWYGTFCGVGIKTTLGMGATGFPRRVTE